MESNTKDANQSLKEKVDFLFFLLNNKKYEIGKNFPSRVYIFLMWKENLKFAVAFGDKSKLSCLHYKLKLFGIWFLKWNDKNGFKEWWHIKYV